MKERGEEFYWRTRRPTGGPTVRLRSLRESRCSWRGVPMSKGKSSQVNTYRQSFNLKRKTLTGKNEDTKMGVCWWWEKDDDDWSCFIDAAQSVLFPVWSSDYGEGEDQGQSQKTLQQVIALFLPPSLTLFPARLLTRMSRRKNNFLISLLTPVEEESEQWLSSLVVICRYSHMYII